MSLDANVMPALLAYFSGLTTTTVIRGVSDGEPPGIPLSPWVILQATSFNVPEPPGQWTTTDWTITARCLYETTNDFSVAEQQLRALIDPIRKGLEAHIKQGQSTIARALVSSGSWGYVLVNNVWFRMMDLDLAVREKETRSYSA